MSNPLQQYRIMFDQMAVGAFFQEPDGSLVDVNQAALEMFGLSRDQFLGRTSYHPEWRVINGDGTGLPPEQHPSMVALRTGIQVSDFVAGVYNPLRQTFTWLSINATPMFRDGEDTPYKVFATLSDITSLIMAEKALAASERRYRAIVNTQNEFVDRYLSGGILTFVNESLCQYVGVAPENLLGNSFYPFIHEEDRERVIREIESLSAKNPVNHYEARAVLRDGSIRWQEWSNHAICDHDGNVIEYQSVGRDITDQKMAEDALLKSEEQYRRFIATATEGIGITDRDYNITYVNDRLAEMLGYQPTELIGMPVFRLLSCDEQDGFPVQMTVQSQGLSSYHECQHLRKDGSQVWLLTSSSPILDDSGSFQGCFAMFTDLTGRKEAEIALQQANDELEKRVVERTAALAKANEQIKLMSFQLVRAQEQERARIAGELHDQVGQSLLLAKMKLDMFVSEISTDKERNSAVDIATLLETCIHDIRTLTFGMRPPLLETADMEAAIKWLCDSIRNDYQLRIDFSYNCRQFSFGGEMRYSLYQAVRELLLNVAKHAGVNRAELSLQTEMNQLVVRVADAGNGFDHQAVRLGHAPGSGFGLFNVQQRIEQMGGSFAVVSASGLGTYVTLTIPLTENLTKEQCNGPENPACR